MAGRGPPHAHTSTTLGMSGPAPGEPPCPASLDSRLLGKDGGKGVGVWGCRWGVGGGWASLRTYFDYAQHERPGPRGWIPDRGRE